MKIYSQNGRGIFEFGSAFIPENGPDNVIRVHGKNESYSHFLGRYTDEARARGVLMDIETAYRRGMKIFYMPLE